MSGEVAKDYAIVLTTCSAEVAPRIAEALVGAKLAGCVQRLPIESTYRWKGEVETAWEVLLLIKIRAADYAAVKQAILALQEYETPEIIMLPV
ncbi:MAG TPA: divalent-cation tolerance protein CutA, partial [Methylovirgula sp.]